MMMQEFESVWDAIESDPSKADNMKLRSQLLMAVQQTVTDWHVSDAEAASRLGVSEEQLADLAHGRIDAFSLDLLTRLASRAGISVRLDLAQPAA